MKKKKIKKGLVAIDCSTDNEKMQIELMKGGDLYIRKQKSAAQFKIDSVERKIIRKLIYAINEMG